MKNLVAVTIDYETWHPLPEGRSIDWDETVFRPTECFLEVADHHQVKLTLMAEMGEYFWLKENDAEIADRMEQQWSEAFQRGHDVQLHLHPNWLPEMGARRENGIWHWDWSKAKASDYPGDLTRLIGTCKTALESTLRPLSPDYQVLCFRAGAYRAQPFSRIYKALTSNHIICDSSVYAGGISAERGYDYSWAYSRHQPYFANALDPQLKAPPSERGMVEIPIFTFEPDGRWFLDGSEGNRFAERLLDYLESQRKGFPFLSPERVFKRYGGALYYRLKAYHRHINPFLPKRVSHSLSVYAPEKLVEHNYFVMIGHTKGEHDFEAIARNFLRLKESGRFQFLRLSDMARQAKQELSKPLRQNAQAEGEYQVQREYEAVLGPDRNEAQSVYLQRLIPLDRHRILDLGCGAGYWSDRISRERPWSRLVGIDRGVDFIRKAAQEFSSPTVAFQVQDFAQLSFARESFDCVYADNTLEHAYDVDATLREVHWILTDGGVLVAAIPSDGRNPGRACDNHTWKTVPHEVRMRLERAGFVNIRIEEVDTFRQLGMPPYPPSNDQMMYIQAWKRSHPASQLDRAVEAMAWVYQALSPEKSSRGNDPREILAQGFAFCWGYAVVLGKLLDAEGYEVQWVSMLAREHPRGQGPQRQESHEVISVQADGRPVILDPMANTCIPHPLVEVLKKPDLAEEKVNPDQRYRERSYHLYDTRAWYSRVRKYAIRPDVDRRVYLWKKNGWRT